MSDLTTFTRAKDWAIILLIGLVFSLLGMVAAENRQRIFDLEERVAYLERNHVQAVSDRLTRLESKVENLLRYKQRRQEIEEE